MGKLKIKKILEKLKSLEDFPYYEAAFIFGSAARNEITKNSDLDVQVITLKDNPSIDILHPYIDGIKLDLSFLSYNQLFQRTKKEESKISQRVIMVSESIILFDKKGFLTKLKNSYKEKEPIKLDRKSYPLQRFLIFHANDKVARNIKEDQEVAMLAMHFGIKELLQIHYAVHGHWWISDKRLSNDLKTWDKELASLLRLFVFATDANKKFNIWSKIVEHILKPMGGHIDISKNEDISAISKQGLKDVATVIS